MAEIPRETQRGKMERGALTKIGRNTSLDIDGKI